MRMLPIGLALVTALLSATCGGKAIDPTPVCSLTIDSVNRTFGSDGGSGTVAVTASAPTCNWTTTSNASWVTISAGASGTGSGTVQYSVAAHTGADVRSATVMAAGRAHTITEQGRSASPCVYSLGPKEGSIDANGGSGSFDLATATGCAWTAISNDSWLTVISSPTGAGEGSINYRAGSHREAGDRTGTIVAGAQTFTLVQAGPREPLCDFILAPADFSVCLSAGTVVSRLLTFASCTWTASTTESWLTIETGAGGVGASDLRIAHSSNDDAPRLGVVSIRGSGSSDAQSIRVAQAGCRYAVSQSTFSIAVTGGAESFDVLQTVEPAACGGSLPNGCQWTPTTDVSWISLANGAARSGDGPVDFTVAANPTGSVRSGAIAVRDQVVRITQAAQ